MNFVVLGQGLIINPATIARITYEEMPLADGTSALDVTVHLIVPNPQERDGLAKFRLSGQPALALLNYINSTNPVFAFQLGQPVEAGDPEI